MRGEWFEGGGAQNLNGGRTGIKGQGRKMQRAKTAIDNLDRVAFCPPAGHLTSSYWAAIASHAVAAVRSLGTEILDKRRRIAASEPNSGDLFDPLVRPLPAPTKQLSPLKLVCQEACASSTSV